ncbi:hypothetical protein BCR34DRAFT_658116 [Clohesyomyces aquaticus]|uniref:Uncharacterized protein n=1 Tax=Clohesyomyces aquaticus TaxID=1231657 RepID=A0A1Y1ZEP3_9PLEO|nr:hypothetical protein BCR34DRAFT_658116 [Clohesyomyces aquaticus]
MGFRVIESQLQDIHLPTTIATRLNRNMVTFFSSSNMATPPLGNNDTSEDSSPREDARSHLSSPPSEHEGKIPTPGAALCVTSPPATYTTGKSLILVPDYTANSKVPPPNPPPPLFTRSEDLFLPHLPSLDNRTSYLEYMSALSIGLHAHLIMRPFDKSIGNNFPLNSDWELLKRYFNALFQTCIESADAEELITQYKDVMKKTRFHRDRLNAAAKSDDTGSAEKKWLWIARSLETCGILALAMRRMLRVKKGSKTHGNYWLMFDWFTMVKKTDPVDEKEWFVMETKIQTKPYTGEPLSFLEWLDEMAEEDSEDSEEDNQSSESDEEGENGDEDEGKFPDDSGFLGDNEDSTVGMGMKENKDGYIEVASSTGYVGGDERGEADEGQYDDSGLSMSEGVSRMSL